MTWALRSLCRPSAKSALTHRPQAGGGTASGSRAPSGVAPPGGPSLLVYQQTPTVACASEATAPITGGLGAFGHQQAAQGIYLCIACHYYQCL